MDEYEAGGLIGVLLGFLFGVLVAVIALGPRHKVEHGMSYRDLVFCSQGNMTVKECIQLNLRIEEITR